MVDVVCIVCSLVFDLSLCLFLKMKVENFWYLDVLKFVRYN